MSNSLVTSVQCPVEDRDAPPEDMIRRECVKVTVIKATILCRVPTSGPIPAATMIEFRERLSKFHDNLPNWMSIGELSGGKSDVLQIQYRPVIFYVHLFYLSAMMLFSRRLIIAHIDEDMDGALQLPVEAGQAIEDGYVAAQTSSRIMELMLAEGKVVQVCWLCM